jgi:hypothetical protein
VEFVPGFALHEFHFAIWYTYPQLQRKNAAPRPGSNLDRRGGSILGRRQHLGPYGGQTTAFEWVFSPRGDDGRPQPLFDRQSGNVDPLVAKYWQDNFDLSAALARLSQRERLALQGKIHIWVGSQDTFHLDRAAILFAEAAKRAGIAMTLTVIPGRDHFDLYTEGTDRLALFKVMAAQMGANRKTYERNRNSTGNAASTARKRTISASVLK